MAKLIRVGIIGGAIDHGWASGTHIPALQNSSEYTISAVSTSRLDSAKKSAETLHAAHAFTDNQVLVTSEDVDLVTVSVKVPFHYESVLAAIKNRKNIYCEWPLAINTDQAKELASLANQAKIHHVIGLQARQSPAVNLLREALLNGEIGRVLSCSLRVAEHAKGTVTVKGEAYILEKKNGATLFTISAGHDLDTIAYILNSPFREVSALLKSSYSEATVIETGEKVSKDTADQILIQGILDNDVPVSVHVQGGIQPETVLEVQGEKGTFRLIQDQPVGHIQFGNLILEKVVHGDFTQITNKNSAATSKEIVYPDAEDQTPTGNIARAYRKLAEDIDKGTQWMPDFNDAVKLHELLDAIRESSITGKRVQLTAD